jgi:2-polyprenyl-3-methyl-5-hydroxy-6-metoxy-1,4-benzoquinol methylase
VSLLLASVDHYNRDAAHFGTLYSQSRFEDVHRAMLPYLPPTGSAVLDIGAGSGRDAVALAQKGYVVTAVEPSSELRRWGQHHYRATGIEWIADRLPDLNILRSSDRRFDFVLCSAVLIHIAPEDLARSLASMANLLTPGGRLAVSVRNRQAQDRADIFHEVPAPALIEAATNAGLQLQHESASADQLGRDVRWQAFVFGTAASRFASHNAAARSDRV